MHFDFADVSATDRYRLMASAITPRPIAWVTSQSAAGIRNAAPYSFFNAFAKISGFVAVAKLKRFSGTGRRTGRNDRSSHGAVFCNNINFNSRITP